MEHLPHPPACHGVAIGEAESAIFYTLLATAKLNNEAGYAACYAGYY
ncbi:MAG: hypothetical protein WBL85_09520 [Sedimentisphaerales bacterium]